jgi:hypothetical protein
MQNWSRVQDERLTPRQTGRLTVGCKLTSTSTSAYDRQSVGQSVLVPGSHDQISFISLTIAGFLIWAPSLTRGWVCNLLVQLLLGLARAVTLGSKYSKIHGHILVSNLRLPQPGVSGPRIEGEVTLRPTVSRPVSLGVRPPSGTHDQFFFLLEIFFRQLRVRYKITNPQLSKENLKEKEKLVAGPERVPISRNPQSSKR